MKAACNGWAIIQQNSLSCKIKENYNFSSKILFGLSRVKSIYLFVELNINECAKGKGDTLYIRKHFAVYD